MEEWYLFVGNKAMADSAELGKMLVGNLMISILNFLLVMIALYGKRDRR